MSKRSPILFCFGRVWEILVLINFQCLLVLFNSFPFFFYPHLMIFLLLFREREEGGEREAWIGGHPVCAVTWEWTHNLGMCPDWESSLSFKGCPSNQLSQTSQSSTLNFHVSVYCSILFSALLFLHPISFGMLCLPIPWSLALPAYLRQLLEVFDYIFWTCSKKCFNQYIYSYLS